MKKKLNSKFMLIAAIAILVTAVCSIGLFYSILVPVSYTHLLSVIRIFDLVCISGRGREENNGNNLYCGR